MHGRKWEYILLEPIAQDGDYRTNHHIMLMRWRGLNFIIQDDVIGEKKRIFWETGYNLSFGAFLEGIETEVYGLKKIIPHKRLKKIAASLLSIPRVINRRLISRHIQQGNGEISDRLEDRFYWVLSFFAVKGGIASLVLKDGRLMRSFMEDTEGGIHYHNQVSKKIAKQLSYALIIGREAEQLMRLAEGKPPHRVVLFFHRNLDWGRYPQSGHAIYPLEDHGVLSAFYHNLSKVKQHHIERERIVGLSTVIKEETSSA